MWPFLEDTPPVTLDWLPWSHTFGGNHNFFMILRNGGTLYVDDGRAAPKLVERTAENLLSVEPTVYFNVPRGFELLLPHLETNDAVRRAFFARLDVCFYAAAALPASIWQRLETAAAREERDVFFTTAWGSTETSPLSTSAHFPTRTAGGHRCSRSGRGAEAGACRRQTGDPGARPTRDPGVVASGRRRRAGVVSTATASFPPVTQ